jgi:abhydrolase domain-containing protein 17
MTTAFTWWKLFRVAGVVVVVGYILFAAWAPFLAPRMMFLPQLGSRHAPPGIRHLATADGNQVAVLYLPNPSARFTIWFFHGNAEDLGDDVPLLESLRALGFAVVGFDYPGYGDSTGRPTETSCYAAARAVRSYLRDELHIPAERTLLYGRSLGGGVATQMAVEERCGGLILQSAFTSAFRVLTHWRLLPFDQFDNLRKIPRVGCPVLVMHGTLDEVIGPWHGEALYAAAREPKRSLWVPGATHNDFAVVAGATLPAALRDVSALCASTAARP